jgi:hypothetical protein
MRATIQVRVSSLHKKNYPTHYRKIQDVLFMMLRTGLVSRYLRGIMGESYGFTLVR